MKRFFSKGSKSEHSDRGSAEVLDEAGATKNMDDDVASPKKTQQRSEETSVGQGDAEQKSSRKSKARRGSLKVREPEVQQDEDSKRKARGQRKKSIEPTTDIIKRVESNDDDETTTAEFIKPPKPFPRRRTSSSMFSASDSEEDNAHFSRQQAREEVEETGGEDLETVIPQVTSRKGNKSAKKGKETKALKKQQRILQKADTGDSEEDPGTQFVSIKDCENMPKVETAKGGHYFSTVYNYKQPLSSFRFRARLLKYPTLNDQKLWSGEMAVVDERIFQWQEKVFSKVEERKYQKLNNCVTEQERKYHDELSHSTTPVGRYLYSYVADDPYVFKKKQKLLTRKCPMRHHQSREKTYTRLAFDTSTRSINSQGDDFDIEAGVSEDNYLNSDDSIDFDEPISSSTPVQGRKTKLKSSASEIAKAEKRVRERKEKELKDLERKNTKLKEMKAKQEKEEEKKRQQEEAKVNDKISKLKAIESKEKELRAAYMKKYKYSKRPSVPLGARMRSVRLTPSPRKLERKKKSYTISRSSEISDFPDDDLGSGPVSLDSKDDGKPSSIEQTAGGESVKKSSKVGTEHEEYGGSRKFSNVGIVGSKDDRKFDERTNYKNTQFMYIMATIPYLSGKYREVVVCCIQNIPNQQALVFKPAMGYRNIEAKRNNIFRLSCELCPPDEATARQKGRKGRKSMGFSVDSDIHGDLGFFESVPKNEFRLSVLGEIATAHGFEASPLCIYYAIDIPKGWRNDSLLSSTEGMTHTCFTNNDGLAHFSHEFSFQLVFSMDFIDEPEPNRHFPSPVIALMAVSMNHPSPRIVYEGYGYVNVPMTPGCHFVKIRMWKPRPRTTVEKMRATFLDISPSLQDMKLAHLTSTESEDISKANLIGLQTDPSGTVKLRLHVIHQSPSSNKDYESNLDLLEKMSSATILKSVQAVIQAFQRARQKAETLKSQYD